MERVIAGPERKGRVLDEQTKHTIAYHESGHALVGHLLPHADPVHKISIISRGRALGYTLSIPKEDKVLNSLGEMRDELAVFMGGRVAEEIFCDDITTGASNDLERATKMARAIVTQYGMSAELGTQVFGQPNHEVFLGRDYGNTQDYSEETAKRIDDEVARIMKDAHDRAYEILASHREQMDLMANVLLERETVEGEACLALLDNTWDEYLKHEDEINARKEAEEAAARARDEHLADPNWKEEPVEPGDQDPNPPYREPAEGDGAREQGFTSARRAHQEAAARDLRAHGLVLRRVRQEVLDLLHLLDGLVDAGHVGELHVGALLDGLLRLGLAEAHLRVVRLLHLVEEEEQDEADDDEGQQRAEQLHERAGQRHLVRHVGMRRHEVAERAAVIGGREVALHAQRGPVDVGGAHAAERLARLGVLQRGHARVERLEGFVERTVIAG